MKTTVIVTGIPAIDKRLRTLPLRIQKKVVGQSMRAGLKGVAAEVKSQVPVDTGLTRSQVKTRVVKRKRRDVVELEVTLGRLSVRAGTGQGTASVGGQLACAAGLFFVFAEG